MVKTHKRKKTSRIRGARTCGWGFRQKHKGHGNKGGFGMAGSGKRGDHKKQCILEGADGKYFGGTGVTSRSTVRKRVLAMNLFDILKKFEGEKKIDLSKYKILGTGDGFKAEIKARTASKMALEKMEKAGGKIILPAEKENVKQHVVKEQPEFDKVEARRARKLKK